MLETMFKMTSVKRVEGQNNVSSKAEKAGGKSVHVHSWLRLPGSTVVVSHRQES